jgi:gliding motility-associatede transport system auxiliary component
MKNINKIIGIVGAVLLSFSLVYYSIQNIWEVLNWITLIFGLFGVGYYLFDYYKNREKEFSKRSLQYGSNILVQIVIVTGIVALLAFITTRQHLRTDWTEDKLYSLADQSEKIISGLDKEVNIIAFFRENEQKGAQDLLDEYAFDSDYISIEFVDPDENPQLAKQYQVKQYNSLIVECGAKKETVQELSEANLTNAIMKVTRDVEKTVYFLTGHGERSITEDGVETYKQATEAIKKENYLVKELNLVRRIAAGKGVPDSCTVLAIVRPISNFFPQELDSIKAYVDGGGKLLVLLDPERNNDIAEFFRDFHVEVGNNMVVDASGMGQLFGAGPAMPLVSNYDNSIAITKDFNVMTFYPQTCSIIPMQDKGDYDIKEILKTSGNSWAEADFTSREAGFNEGRDIPGPVTIAVLIEKSVKDKKLGIVLFGDSDFAKNGYFKNQGNADLFLNTINYLAEEEDLISIRPKEIDDRRVTLTQAEVTTIFYLVVIAIPLLVIIAGVVFYIKRGK